MDGLSDRGSIPLRSIREDADRMSDRKIRAAVSIFLYQGKILRAKFLFVITG